MAGQLKGKKIAFLVADGFEQIELTRPWQDISDAGAEVQLISLHSGEVQGMDGDINKADTFKVDKTVDEVAASDYDGLILPGGTINPDGLRVNETAVSFVRDFFKQHKPVAAICHAPITLIEAGVVDGRTLTSFPSIKTDLQNAGANWVDREMVCDEGLVTSRSPDDLDAFCSKAIEEFAEGKHEEQTT
ncbi:type 1 glutamine amidotransferase domain-containing protein [Salinisphaera sp.]|uniref:type 1 glutamine amidotransferase domain-containing protein n=1 Tax=Salinisphaera sp. TaxID=1914330 RepID=UPI002D780141|nr:type 1 glutamine amidotransferase domain-containing protein [Salinisphaera sp.]HET7313292.1 type 1 glutamine amidotransferase domain-containing protein [Salinisphaera sp.]